MTELLLERAQRCRVAGAQIHFHPGLARNRVDRRAAANPPDIERRPRRPWHLEIGDARRRAPQRVNRIHHAERAEAVPTRALEGHAKARASDSDVRNAQPFAVDRDKAIDPLLQRFVEEALDAPQITEALFAHRAHECNRAGRRHAGFVQRPRHGDQIGEPATIVANTRTAQHISLAANADVGAFRKHGVEMGAHDEVRPRAGAGPLADDVPLGVNANVFQPGFPKHRRVELCALCFLKRRRFNLADPDLIVDRLHLVRPCELDCRSHRRLLKEKGAQIGRALLRGHDGRGSRQSQEERCQEPA